jgi:hypothetical protein
VSMSTKITTLISAPYSPSFKHCDPTDPTLLVRGAIYQVRDLPRVRKDPRTSARAHHRGRGGAQGRWDCAAEGVFTLRSDAMCCVLCAACCVQYRSLRPNCGALACLLRFHTACIMISPALPLPLSPEAQFIWLFDCSTVIMIS